jgi:hypothetical protein
MALAVPHNLNAAARTVCAHPNVSDDASVSSG